MKRKRYKKFLTIVVLLIIGGVSGCLIYNQYKEVNQIRLLFQQLEGTTKINEYTIYGNHLNIRGSIKLDSKISKITLVLKNYNMEREFPLIYKQDKQQFNFELSSDINNGINLETIEEGNYYIFIKVYRKNKVYYYSLINGTNYQDLEYYTLTNNNYNKKIKLNINEFELENKNIQYFKISCKKHDINPEIYDIVIDPGHGGIG